jgi:hypothetical protein
MRKWMDVAVTEVQLGPDSENVGETGTALLISGTAGSSVIMVSFGGARAITPMSR